MADLGVEVRYLAAGGNLQPEAADWSANGTLAFGAGHNIALLSPDVSVSWDISYIAALWLRFCSDTDWSTRIPLLLALKISSLSP